MGVNKLIVNDEVKLDLTGDTVAADKMLEGATAHNAAGDLVTGTIPVNPQLSVADGGAVTVPQGYYSGSELIGYLLPIPTAEDTNKMVVVNAEGTGYTLGEMPTGGGGETGQPGADGEDGGYYTPSVDSEGNLSWTASKADMPSVPSTNIQGPQGPQGPPGEVPNFLAGKKILIAGDSVAYGYGWPGGFKNLIEENFPGAETMNAAFSGATLAGSQILSQISATINNEGFMPDIVILDGGWNDLMLGTPIGTVDFNQFVLTWGESTILEMMETIFYQFRNLFPSIAVIYFILYKIQPFSSETTMPEYTKQRDFVENVKLLCDKYGVTCVDFWDNSCIVPDIETNRVKYMADFLHINEAGYRVIWPLLREKLKIYGDG